MSTFEEVLNRIGDGIEAQKGFLADIAVTMARQAECIGLLESALVGVTDLDATERGMPDTEDAWVAHLREYGDRLEQIRAEFPDVIA